MQFFLEGLVLLDIREPHIVLFSSRFFFRSQPLGSRSQVDTPAFPRCSASVTSFFFAELAQRTLQESTRRNHLALSFPCHFTEILRLFFLHFFFQLFHHFFAIPATSLFLPFSKAAMSSTKKPSASKTGRCFVTSLNASCRTMRKSKQLHLDPGEMAVMVWSGRHALRLWCST